MKKTDTVATLLATKAVFRMLLGSGNTFGDATVPHITPMMENQMEKNMENKMEAGIIQGLYYYSSRVFIWGTMVPNKVSLGGYFGFRV